MNPIREHVEGKWNHVQRLEAVSPTVSWQNPTGIQSWRENVHVTEPKSLVATPKHCIITLQYVARVYFLYSSGWDTNKPLITRFSCLANLLACELIIPQQTLHKVRETCKGPNNYSASGRQVEEELPVKQVRLWISKAAAGKMRNMSDIPKLQAHTKQSSCCSVKVVAHNKELSESALTSQWLRYPAVKATHSTLCTCFFFTAVVLSDWRQFCR